MTIRLRPHHLLCLLTYVGKGYSPAFVANYNRIAQRLSDGEGIVVVVGPDDICAPLLADQNVHCHCTSVRERDQKAADALQNLLGVTVVKGIHIVSHPERFRQLRSAYAAGVIRSACIGCTWSDFCTSVAQMGYEMARVHSPTVIT